MVKEGWSRRVDLRHFSGEGLLVSEKKVEKMGHHGGFLNNPDGFIVGLAKDESWKKTTGRQGRLGRV